MFWAKAFIESSVENRAGKKLLAVEKPRPRNLWYPDLDSLMVALSLHGNSDDEETLSLSSSESYDLDQGVRFGTIEIREYQVIKGEHPFCRDGLAMSLGWEYKQNPSINIEEVDDDIEDEHDYDDDDSFGEDYSDQEFLDEDEEDTRDDNIDYINTRPKRLNYFERRLLLEQAGHKVEDCYGEVRSSIWLCVDEELPPDDDNEEIYNEIDSTIS